MLNCTAVNIGGAGGGTVMSCADAASPVSPALFVAVIAISYMESGVRLDRRRLSVALVTAACDVGRDVGYRLEDPVELYVIVYSVIVAVERASLISVNSGFRYVTVIV